MILRVIFGFNLFERIMSAVKRFFKNHSHSQVFKPMAGFGRALNRFYENRNHDVYSNGEMTILKKISKLNPAAVIIDGGANTGGYAIMGSQVVPHGKIYSFEPVTATFEKLAENTKSMSCIHTVNKGLFAENCTREINLFTSDEHSSLYDIEGIKDKSGKKERIELIKGDDFIREKKLISVDLLKLDVEGAEYEALKGFDSSLKEGVFKAVQFEYGYINITTKKLLIDYYLFFKQYGYKVGKIFPQTVEFREYSFVHEDFIGPNFIAVKETEKELIDLLISKRA